MVAAHIAAQLLGAMKSLFIAGQQVLVLIDRDAYSRSFIHF